MEEQELALQFAEGFWNVTGEAEDLRRSQAAITILDALRQAGGMQTVKELCTTLGTPENVMRVRLCRMQQRGEIQALGEGRYALLTWTPTPTPGGITYGVPREESRVIPVMFEEEPPAPEEETPAAEEDVQDQEKPAGEPAAAEEGITPITADAPQTPRDELIFRSAPTNGHSNGYGQPHTHGPSNGHAAGKMPRTLCHHVWHAADDGVTCQVCGVHHPGRMA